MSHIFTALDFETATSNGNSVCQIGIVKVMFGVVTDRVSILVQPPNNEYNYWNTKVHGITAMNTRNAPTFDMVWDDISHFFEGQTVVAHNGKFDFSCLAKVLDYYQLPHPKYVKKCTFVIFKKGLKKLCDEHGIHLNHHDALSDAEACAILYMKHLGLQV